MTVDILRSIILPKPDLVSFCESNTLTATNADPNLLYLLSVQSPEDIVCAIHDICSHYDFVPSSFREDFSGTGLNLYAFLTACPWASGVACDIDESLHEWSSDHIAPLLDKSVTSRARFVKQDVRKASVLGSTDLVFAGNYSFHLFNPEEIEEYFADVYASLNPGGLLILDCVCSTWQDIRSNPEMSVECNLIGPQGERTSNPLECAFYYEWHTHFYNPFTRRFTCSISFAFKDGSRWNSAFEYNGYNYAPAELITMLRKAGFAVEPFIDRMDEYGEEVGYYVPSWDGQSQESLPYYLAARKRKVS